MRWNAMYVFFIIHLILIPYVGAQSVASLATGGTGRATVEPGDIVFLNPASLVHLRGRYFYSGVYDQKTGFVLSDSSKDSLFAGALGFSQTKIKNNFKFNDFSVTMADFIVSRWTLGLTGHFYDYQKEDPVRYKQNNLDIGILYTPTSNFGIGLVAQNVMSRAQNLPWDFPPQKSYGLGVNWIYRQFIRTRADVVVEEFYTEFSPTANEATKIMLGLENFMNSWLVTRLGYQSDFTREINKVSLGFGFQGPRFGINYVFISELGVAENQSHGVDLHAPF